MRNWEAESIRSRVESMGGCVKLKTVTEVPPVQRYFCQTGVDLQPLFGYTAMLIFWSVGRQIASKETAQMLD